MPTLDTYYLPKISANEAKFEQSPQRGRLNESLCCNLPVLLWFSSHLFDWQGLQQVGENAVGRDTQKGEHVETAVPQS